MTSARSQHPDHALRENAEQRSHHGTHLAPDAAGDALFVTRGSGALGSNNGALSVRAGVALVEGTEHTLGSDAAIDIAGGDGDPRRDVVYLAPTSSMPDAEQQMATGDGAALGVREGTPGAFAHDSALSEDDKTITNAYRPPPPDFAGSVGFPLAVVTVTANAGTLPAGALTELRAEAPAAARRQDRFGGRWVLDPGTPDFGTGVNKIDAKMSPGDHLFVPPGDYDATTTATIDTPDVTVYSNAVATAYGNQVSPQILQQGDVTPLHINAANVGVHGLNVFSGVTNSDTSVGIEATGARTRIDGCYVRGFGSHGIYLRQRKGRSINNAVVANTAVTHNSGDGVRIGNDSDTTTANRNSIRVSLTNATKNEGWAINCNTYAFGNEYKILNYTDKFSGDSISPNGGIRHDSIDSYARIVYMEGTTDAIPGIEFGGVGNTGEIWHVRNSYPYDSLYNDTSNGGNFKWQYSKPNKPVFVGDELAVGGTLRAADVLNQTPQSSPPSSPDTDDIYVDDGTNTSDGSRGFRQFDGSAWVDF